LMKVVLSNFAGDEVWFLEYDQEAKGKAFRWKHWQVQVMKSQINTMLIILFDVRSIAVFEFNKQGRSTRFTV
jgi:hypothetical protein